MITDNYLKNKERYDKWRKANKYKQAWHQFNHSRRSRGKIEYTFSEYLLLKKNKTLLNKNKNLNSAKTKKLI
jgi:hypothetical protein